MLPLRFAEENHPPPFDMTHGAFFDLLPVHRYRDSLEFLFHVADGHGCRSFGRQRFATFGAEFAFFHLSPLHRLN